MRRRLPGSLILRPGSVLDTYPSLGLGNYLYFALQAHIARSEGRRAWVLDTGLDRRWLETFPKLIPLLAGEPTAMFRRKRFIPEFFHQRFGADFTRVQLERFVREILLSPGPPILSGPDLVINVRRGDYYTDPEFRRIYGFDVVDYVGKALAVAATASPVSWLSIVSDDVPWCRQSLGWVEQYAESVTFGSRLSGAVGDFWEVATGRRLIIMNSTFSYWAAYTSQVLNGSEQGEIWAPSFHQRNINSGRPWQHDPRWNRLDVSEPYDGKAARLA